MLFALTRRCSRAVLLAILTALAVGPAWGALEPAQVLILVNRDTPISARVASMYQKLRAIPNENLLRLSLGTDRSLTPEQYWSKAGGPIKKYLEERDIWNPKGSGWCVNLMRRGAAVTLGPAFEPYLAAFPHGDISPKDCLPASPWPRAIGFPCPK